MDTVTGDRDVGSVHTGGRLAKGIVVGIRVGTIGGSIGVGSKEESGISISITLTKSMDISTRDRDISGVHTGGRFAIGIGQTKTIGVGTIAIGAIEEGRVSLSIGSSNQSRCKDKELHVE